MAGSWDIVSPVAVGGHRVVPVAVGGGTGGGGWGWRELWPVVWVRELSCATWRDYWGWTGTSGAIAGCACKGTAGRASGGSGTYRASCDLVTSCWGRAGLVCWARGGSSASQIGLMVSCEGSQGREAGGRTVAGCNALAWGVGACC